MEPVLGIRWENKIKVCNPKGEGNTELGFKNHQKWWDPLRRVAIIMPKLK
jgi:hypothetical protein